MLTGEKTHQESGYDSLHMEAQITNIAKLTFFHLCQGRQLAPFLLDSDLGTFNSDIQARLLKLALCWPALEADLENLSGPECGGTSPNRKA